MKVAVVGAAGKMALGAIRELVESSDVEQVYLSELRKIALERRLIELESHKLVAQPVDIRNRRQLIALLEGCDVCLNASLHYLNEEVMEACLEAGTHYTDLGGLFHWARRQFALDQKFREAGLTAVVGAGSAPGTTNVMARYAYDQLEAVHSVKIYDGIVNLQPRSNGFAPPYALETLLDEFCMNPYEYRDGEFVECKPFSGREVVDFPEPVGTQTVYNTLHTEVVTLPLSFRAKGIREVSFKLSLPADLEDKLRLFCDLGFGSREPVNIDGTMVSPRNVFLHMVNEYLADRHPLVPPDVGGDHKVLRVVVQGTSAGQAVEYIMESIIHSYEKWRMPMGVFSVGFPAAVMAKMIGRGEIAARGVLPAEQVVSPESYFRELAARGISVAANLKRILG